MSKDKMREAFEVWCRDEWLGGGRLFKEKKLRRRDSGIYEDKEMHFAWNAWQSALTQQPESEPAGELTSEVSREGNFLARLYPGHEMQNGDKLYTSPQPCAQVPEEWTDQQCIEFVKIALRHVEHSEGSTLTLDDVRLGVKHALKAAPSIAEKPDIPSVLFDGFAVYTALSDKAKARTGTDNVSDVLDAVVALMRGPEPSEVQS